MLSGSSGFAFGMTHQPSFDFADEEGILVIPVLFLLSPTWGLVQTFLLQFGPVWTCLKKHLYLHLDEVFGVS